MLDFGGAYYYFDIQAFDKAVEPTGQKPSDKITTSDTKIFRGADGEIISTEEIISERIRGKELDPAKYDIFKSMVDYILDYEHEGDSSLGAERALNESSLSFKIAFNTLYINGILKEKE